MNIIPVLDPVTAAQISGLILALVGFVKQFVPDTDKRNAQLRLGSACLGAVLAAVAVCIAPHAVITFNLVCNALAQGFELGVAVTLGVKGTKAAVKVVTNGVKRSEQALPSQSQAAPSASAAPADAAPSAQAPAAQSAPAPAPVSPGL